MHLGAKARERENNWACTLFDESIFSKDVCARQSESEVREREIERERALESERERGKVS